MAIKNGHFLTLAVDIGVFVGKNPVEVHEWNLRRSLGFMIKSASLIHRSNGQS